MYFYCGDKTFGAIKYVNNATMCNMLTDFMVPGPLQWQSKLAIK
jgi:hypothetical protein